MADKWIQLMSEDGTDNLFPISKWDLLWENSAQTTAFGAQTITVDISDYDYFVIVYKRNTTSAQFGFYIAMKGYNSTYYDVGTIFRIAEPLSNGTGVRFDAGYVGSTVSNTSAIPCYIYGIR